MGTQADALVTAATATNSSLIDRSQLHLNYGM